MNAFRETFQQIFSAERGNVQRAGLLLALAFPVLALVVDKAASTIFAIFFLAGLWLLIRGRVEKPDPAMRWVLIAFAVYFLVGVLSFFLGEQTRLGEKLLGRDIRFFGGLVVWVAVARLSMTRSLVEASFALGGVVTGAAAVIEIFLADMPGYRASGETISILFGHLAAGLAVINLAYAIYAKSLFRYIFLIAAAAAFIAVLLSETRGALLSLTVVIAALVMTISFRHRIPWRRGSLAVAVLLMLVVASMFGNSRFESLFSEISDFRQQSRFAESINWPETPACFNNPEFLHWLVRNLVPSGSANLDIAIREIELDNAWRSTRFPCSGGYKVVIRNPDEHHWGWVYFPRRSVPRDGYESAIVAVGQGQIALPLMPRDARVDFDSDRVQVVTLDGALSTDPRYLLLFAPGHELAFAPVIFSDYEYAFSNKASSFGTRIMMWKAALHGFVEFPFFGRGAGAFPEILHESAQAGLSARQLTEFDHAHNEILTIAAERGIIGLLALFAVYAAPFWLFYRRRDAVGLAGMAFVASIFLSGLTETIFNHSLGITYYCMLVLLLATTPEEPAGAERNFPETTPG